LDDLYKKVTAGKKSAIAVACAEDAHVLEAVSGARGMADFMLIGDAEKIRIAAESAGADITGMEIIHEPEATKACVHAVSLVSSGKAEALMKGLVDTSVIMKAVLDKEAGMRTERKLSHLAVF